MVQITSAAYDLAEHYRQDIGPQWLITLEKIQLEMKSQSEMSTADWLVPLANTNGELCLHIEGTTDEWYLTVYNGSLLQLQRKDTWDDSFAGPFAITIDTIEDLLSDTRNDVCFVTQQNTPFTNDK